jgi:hypothetical protein
VKWRNVCEPAKEALVSIKSVTPVIPGLSKGWGQMEKPPTVDAPTKKESTSSKTEPTRTLALTFYGLPNRRTEVVEIVLTGMRAKGTVPVQAIMEIGEIALRIVQYSNDCSDTSAETKRLSC